MAKVGSKSRLYQQQQQLQQQSRLSPVIGGPSMGALNFSSTTGLRPQTHHLSTLHNSPTTRQKLKSNNLMGKATMLNPSLRDSQQLMANSSSLAHLQSSHFVGNNLNPMNYLNQQQQQHQLHNNHHQQQQQVHGAANFDRSKSTAIINLIATKQQQSTINLPKRSNMTSNFHSNSVSNESGCSGSNNPADFGKFSTAAGFRGFQDRSTALSVSKPAFSEL